MCEYIPYVSLANIGNFLFEFILTFSDIYVILGLVQVGYILFIICKGGLLYVGDCTSSGQ